MTTETMQRVTEELQRRGIDATFEYPGSISVPARTCDGESSALIAFGDQGDTIDGDVSDDQWATVIEVIESTIPRDCSDVERIANHIACYARGRS